MSDVLMPNVDYTLSDDMKTVTLTVPPEDGITILCQYAPPVPVGVHRHITDAKSEWNPDAGENTMTLSEDMVVGSLQVFRDTTCGMRHTHVTDTFAGDGETPVFELSFPAYFALPPKVTIDGDVVQPAVNGQWVGATGYTLAGDLITFTVAPANLTVIIVSYERQSNEAWSPPHSHYTDILTVNEGTQSYWDISHSPDRDYMQMYRLRAGVVTLLLFGGETAEYFVVDNKVAFAPPAQAGDGYVFFYSYCKSGVGAIEGSTYFGIDDNMDYTQPGGPYTASVGEFSLICESGNCSFGLGTSFEPVGVSYGGTAEVIITDASGNTTKKTFLNATYYGWSGNTNLLYKVVNNKTPIPMNIPCKGETFYELVGFTLVGSKEVDSGFAFDTGNMGNTSAGNPIVAYSTANGGGSWTVRTIVPGAGGGIFAAQFHVSGWSVLGGTAGAPVSNSRIYVSILNGDAGQNYTLVNGIYRSLDGGTTWTQVLGNLASSVRNVYVDFGLAADGSEDLVFALGGQHGFVSGGYVHRSEDGGATWVSVYQIGGGLDNGETMWSSGGTLFILAEQSNDIYKSSDNGITWNLSQTTSVKLHGTNHRGPFVPGPVLIMRQQGVPLLKAGNQTGTLWTSYTGSGLTTVFQPGASLSAFGYSASAVSNSLTCSIAGLVCYVNQAANEKIHWSGNFLKTEQPPQPDNPNLPNWATLTVI